MSRFRHRPRSETAPMRPAIKRSAAGTCRARAEPSHEVCQNGTKSSFPESSRRALQATANGGIQIKRDPAARERGKPHDVLRRSRSSRRPCRNGTKSGFPESSRRALHAAANSKLANSDRGEPRRLAARGRGEGEEGRRRETAPESVPFRDDR
ncbi:hypothetical protein THAOC_21758, partial [Thalassiosira oceanica]